MAVSSCQLLLDLPEQTKLLTGTTLKGIFKYELKKDVGFKSITITVAGSANCAWYHRHKCCNKPTNEVVRFQANEDYPIGKLYLLKKDKNDKVPVAAGSYEHPFKFNISECIPPSFKNELGEIKYHIVIKFKKFGFFTLNKEFKHEIQIRPAVPDSIPEGPITVGLDKTLTKLFSDRTRKISVKAKIDKGYLSPSCNRKINYTVMNDSDVKPIVKTELISTTIYKDTQNNTKVEIKAIDECTVKTPSVVENSIANMHNSIRVLPYLYTVRNSSIITREFKLKFTLKLPLPHLNASVEVPIFIGERKEISVDVSEEVAQNQLGDAPPTYWESINDTKTV